MKKLTLIWIIILVICFTSASCEEGQIDINSAPLEELDKLTGIGPVKAQAIIDTRPFQNVDNLIDVVGIGEITLANIKTQGLACVEEENNQNEQEENEEKEEQTEEKSEIIESNLQETQKITEKELEPIVLSPKNIKSDVDKEELTKNKFAIYGLIIFCILLASLFAIKIRKEKKNEFK